MGSWSLRFTSIENYIWMITMIIISFSSFNVELWFRILVLFICSVIKSRFIFTGQFLWKRMDYLIFHWNLIFFTTRLSSVK